MNSLLLALRHYADFRGRTPRQPFWSFIVLSQCIGFLLLLPLLVSFMQCWWQMLHDSLLQDSIVSMLEDIGSAEQVFKEQVVPQAVEFIFGYYADFPSFHPWTFWCTLLAALWLLVFLVPTLSAGARRLRDAGHSPWWVLAPVAASLPVEWVAPLGLLLSVVTLVLWCLPSVEAPEQKSA